MISLRHRRRPITLSWLERYPHWSDSLKEMVRKGARQDVKKDQGTWVQAPCDDSVNGYMSCPVRWIDTLDTDDNRHWHRV